MDPENVNSQPAIKPHQNAKWLVILSVVVIIILGAIFSYFAFFNKIINTNTQNTGIANPASIYCEQQGGRSEIRTAADGSQTGWCVFSDGRECDEWEFFRTKNCNLKSITPTLVTSPVVTRTPTLTSAPVGSGNIRVSSPLPNTVISGIFTVSGEARVFENQFSYRLKDADGSILAHGSITANGQEAGQFAPFSTTISSYSTPKGKTGTLELFDNSPKDGSEIDKVIIPVVFSK